MAGPLAAIRVVEVASYITGPYAAMLLADLGADVIKIEPPGRGDPFRAWGDNLYSAHYCAYNRNKKSVTLKLQDPEGTAVLRRLARGADVLIENFRPGVAERLGFGYETLRGDNPRLVYCSLSGFGQSGPYVKRPAYDSIITAMSGALSQLTDLDKPEALGPPLSDNLGGLFAVYAVLAALVARGRTGQGQRVTATMLAASTAFLVEPITRYFMTGTMPGPTSRPRASQVYAFVASDGLPLVVHLSSPPKFWAGLLTALDRMDLHDDPRFATRDLRERHYTELSDILKPIFATRPREHWLALLRNHDVPVAPINSLAEVFDDPQARHLGLRVDMEGPYGRLSTVGYPVTFAATPLAPPQPPPALGADTDAVLLAHGLTTDEIAALRAASVI